MTPRKGLTERPFQGLSSTPIQLAEPPSYMGGKFNNQFFATRVFFSSVQSTATVRLLSLEVEFLE